MLFLDCVMINICFGGEGLLIVYVILLLIGKLVKVEWFVLGLLFNFLNI